MSPAGKAGILTVFQIQPDGARAQLIGRYRNDPERDPADGVDANFHIACGLVLGPDGKVLHLLDTALTGEARRIYLDPARGGDIDWRAPVPRRHRNGPCRDERSHSQKLFLIYIQEMVYSI